MNTIINLFISDLSGVILLTWNAMCAGMCFGKKSYKLAMMSFLTTICVGFWLV